MNKKKGRQNRSDFHAKLTFLIDFFLRICAHNPNDDCLNESPKKINFYYKITNPKTKQKFIKY